MSPLNLKLFITILFIQKELNSYQLPSPLTLNFILEYAKWRSWKQVVLFDDFSTGKNNLIKYGKALLNCFNQQGISLSYQPINNPNLPDTLRIDNHRVASVVLIDNLNFTSSDNVLSMASSKRFFDYYISWLLVTSNPNDSSIDQILRNLTIGMDADVVVATSFYSVYEQHDKNHHFYNRTCHKLKDYAKKYEYKKSLNDKMEKNSNLTRNLDYSVIDNRTLFFYYLINIYKIRLEDNLTMIIDPLGKWYPGVMLAKFPVNVVLRNNFHRLPIRVGILNGTNDDQDEERFLNDDKTPEEDPLNDFITFLINNLNASLEFIEHEKVGTITNKVWSNLLGDVFNGIVDIGLGYITVNDERRRDMAFSHPLIRYTRNIYIRPPESGYMRDIFLQPFNNRLLICVAIVYMFIITSFEIINYAVKHSFPYNSNNKYVTFGESTVWCTAIMCMQGTPWNPRTLSGKVALLASLIFALVIYNAYAGFITSILSVQASNIRTLEDILKNNFKLGYSEHDDEFMRNANDSNLRELYIKAFNGRESRLDINLGLEKVSKGGYGFFVSATLARRSLKTYFVKERCLLKEIEIGQTFTTVALPMEKPSPYRKIINLSILKMRERGVIDRIGKRMLPDMPKCQEQSTFHSARIADVYSAFIILTIGIVLSVCLCIIERIWYQRKYLTKGFNDKFFIYFKKKHSHPSDSHWNHQVFMTRWPVDKRIYPFQH